MKFKLFSLYFFLFLFLFSIFKLFHFNTLAKNINFNSSPVYAIITCDTTVFFDDTLKKPIKNIPANSFVEILQDKSEKVYLIKSLDFKIKGWVSSNYVHIPSTPSANLYPVSSTDIEHFINSNNFKSDSPFFIFVDIDRQFIYILKGKVNNWALIKTIPCSTGKNSSPTTRGLFKTSDKGEWFFSDRLNSGAKYWVRFNGSYLFHSLPMDKDKNITDFTLGQRKSSGCVRMSVKDSFWFYKNIPFGTSVFIN